MSSGNASTAMPTSPPTTDAGEFILAISVDKAATPAIRRWLELLNRYVNNDACNYFACDTMAGMSLAQFGTLQFVDGADIPFKYGYSSVIDYLAKSLDLSSEVMLDSVVDRIEWNEDIE